MATLLANIPELELIGAFDRGVPNEERIALKPKMTVDIGGYAIVLGVRYLNTDMVVPVKDAMFWFGSGTVEANDWLFLFTGPGKNRTIPNPEGNGKMLLVYWGQEHTLFHEANVEPVLWRISGVEIPKSPEALPQTGRLAQS